MLFPMSSLKCVLLCVSAVVLSTLLHSPASRADMATDATSIPGKLDVLASGFNFTEGPVVFADGSLVFSDVPGNRMHRWSAKGGVSVFREPSGWANGNALDQQGRLVTAQHDGSLTRTVENGDRVPLVSHYNGKRLNSPNDLVVARDGSIYFTDPSYGIRYQGNGPGVRDEEQPYRGVYVLRPQGKLELVTAAIDTPNGLGLSPDEGSLYITDSEAGALYRMQLPGGNPKHIATLQNTRGENLADGLAVDGDGRVYVAGKGGIWEFAGTGEVLGVIAMGRDASNVALGSEDSRTLFITAGDSVYRFTRQ